MCHKSTFRIRTLEMGLKTMRIYLEFFFVDMRLINYNPSFLKLVFDSFFMFNAIIQMNNLNNFIQQASIYIDY